VHSDSSDKMQWLGEFLDGHFGIVREASRSRTLNVGVPKVGHSGLLRDPKYFDLWLIDGFVDFLKGADMADAAVLTINGNRSTCRPVRSRTAPRSASNPP
jgi:hypothetical protein